MEIISKEVTESTNDDIAELARKGYPHLTTVVAQYQTRGRGRRGNNWEAKKGNHLLFSTLIRPSVEPKFWSRIPQIAGMEMIQTVEDLYHQEEGIKMKWPNDLYYFNRKWSGILVESKPGIESFATLGMGVNCLGSPDDYPDELRKSVTTLQEIYRTNDIDPRQILKGFLTRIKLNLSDSLTDFDRVVEFSKRRDFLYGRTVTVEEESAKVAGTASGIGPNGELIIVKPCGERRLIFGGTVSEIDSIR
ncbi:MAG: biotin--[acetyl-CoA-carboxylase] ligase [Verrucomicrobiales bacterium]|nr:biotin--[acetyl-CoA-carboxylase] ligase [Verrucomicrobiales bacterium]